jgi:hypothetical protein
MSNPAGIHCRDFGFDGSVQSVGPMFTKASSATTGFPQMSQMPGDPWPLTVSNPTRAEASRSPNPAPLARDLSDPSDDPGVEHYVRVPFTDEDLIAEIIGCLGDGPLLRKAPDLTISRLGRNDAAIEIGDQTFVVMVEESHPVKQPD